MAFEKKTFAPEEVAKARRLYENTQTPLGEVAASLGISRTTLASRIREWGWTPRQAVKQAKPARRNSVPAVRGRKSKGQEAKRKSISAKRTKTPEDLTPQTLTSKKVASEKQKPTKSVDKTESVEPPPQKAPSPAALAVRAQRVVERELDAIDQILGAIGAADAAEAERSARTLASLARALKEVMRLAAPDESAEADDDDPVPRDLDEFRRELARRLEALAGGGTDETSGDGG